MSETKKLKMKNLLNINKTNKEEKEEKEKKENIQIEEEKNETENKTNIKKLQQIKIPKDSNKMKKIISKLIKIKKFIFIKQKINIPNLYINRIEFIKKLFYDEDKIFTIKNFSNSTNFNVIGNFFQTNFKNIIEISSAIILFIYTHYQIEIKNLLSSTINQNENRTVKQILESKIINTIDELYSFYQEICNYSSVKIDVIEGLIKLKGYKIGDSLYHHKWCAIDYGFDKYYFFDVFNVLGNYNLKTNSFEKDLKPFYFLTPNEFFIEDHRAYDIKYLYNSNSNNTKNIINIKEFSRKSLIEYEPFYHNVFKYDIKLLSHAFQNINYDQEEIIIKLCIKNFEIIVNCNVNEKEIPEENIEIKNSEESTINLDIKLKFINDGLYNLMIYGKLLNSIDEKLFLLNYKINYKKSKKLILPIIPLKAINTLKHMRVNSTLHMKVFKSKNKKENIFREKKLTKSESDFANRMKLKCFDNKGAFCFEPHNKFLKIGQNQRFKVKVMDAKFVFVLDGRKWNILKKSENGLYEGNFVIKNENIVICALKSNNIYTEIFEFLALN